MDNCCATRNILDTRAYKQFHNGRFYSCFAGDGFYSSGAPYHRVAKGQINLRRGIKF